VTLAIWCLLGVAFIVVCMAARDKYKAQRDEAQYIADWKADRDAWVKRDAEEEG